MTISTAKRRLVALIGCLFGWGAIFVVVGFVVGFPIFHLYFKVPIATISSYIGICCVLQLALVEWLVYAKKTAQGPDGWAFHRTVATTVFVTAISLLFFYYLRRGRPDPETREFTSICMGDSLIRSPLAHHQKS